ncbi:MAG: gliding motility-associated C-terminal domain-containing protein, partial [Bacteroidales bacterium]|nr:gliding motility-associated C-terminal domain-containing protein [Bacteroidales bacterium]
SNYATNIDYWTTICPSQSNSRTKLEFDMFDIHPTDTVIIYYGKTIDDIRATNSLNGKDYFQNSDLEGKQISPPIIDVSGCLTFRLKSDRTGVAKGWKARVSCEATCQDVEVKLADSFTKYDENGTMSKRPVRDAFDVDTVKVPDPSLGYDITIVDGLGNTGYYRLDTVYFKAIDICQGDSVILEADPQFPYNDNAYHQTPQNCIYIWGFGDSDAGYDTVKYNPRVGHKWAKVSGYDLNLNIIDTSYGGCTAKNTINARVRIAQNPIKIENNIPDMCSGDKQPINVDYSGTATIVIDSMHINQAEREFFDTRKFIPDGGHTPTGSQTYTSTINFTSFAPGITLSSGSEILDVCVNMEHSSIGDLGIQLECPDGKNVQLKYNTQTKDAGKRIFLGVPAGDVKYGYITAGTADDTLKVEDSVANPIGECWQYCWSNTFLRNQQGVLTGLAPNIVRNYSLSADGMVFVNNTVDSTHYWGVRDTVHLSSSIPPDTIHIYKGVEFYAKGNDTLISSDGVVVPFMTGMKVQIKEGDSYSAVSTGREYIFNETSTINQFNFSEEFQQSMPVIENGKSFPPSVGDTVKLHYSTVTYYKNSSETTPSYGDYITILDENTLIVKGTSEETITADSIRLVTTQKQEYYPYKNDVYVAQYGDYIRTISYIYTRDSVINTGDTSQFLQTPKQGVTGNTAYTDPPSQNYLDATTVDLNGFNSLIGCPLNGAWTIKVTDDMPGDNGWICGWWMDINLSSATDWTYSVPIDTVIWGGPFITNASSMSAIVAPPITQSGSFTYNVKVVDDFGCQWPATTHISVVGTPIVNLGADKNICEGKSVTLDAGNAGAFSYNWEPTGDTTRKITVTPGENEFGTKTYIVMVTNYNNNLYCYGNDTINVNVHPGAAAAFTSDKYPLEGCEPYTFQLISTSSEADKYEWKLGEYTSQEVNPSFTFSAGVYDLDLKVTSKYGCSDDLHYPGFINVYQMPKADFSWNPATPYSSNPAVTMVNLTEPNNEQANRYRWEIQTNKFNPMDIENLFGRTPYYKWEAQNGENVSGEYIVTLDAYTYNVAPSGNVYECHDTISKVITIINDNITFPTVVTPNGDGINDVFVIHNLIEGQAYPDNELAIYNRYGKRIYFAQDIRSSDQFWDPEQTKSPTGTYFYHFIAKGPIKNMEFNGTVEVLRD